MPLVMGLPQSSLVHSSTAAALSEDDYCLIALEASLFPELTDLHQWWIFGIEVHVAG